MRHSTSALRLHTIVRLTRRRLYTLYFLFLTLCISGIVWLWAHDFPHADLFDASPYESWSMKVHGATTMLWLLLLGSVLHEHARRAWQLGRNRGSGALLATSMAFLIVSAWGLYYLGDENWRRIDAILHWGMGLTALPLIYLHQWLGRRRPMRRGDI